MTIDGNHFTPWASLAGGVLLGLALVRGGAIAVGLGAFAMARKRTMSFLGAAIHLPERSDIDPRLLIGSLCFGVGWGLAGFCPGPAVVAAGAGNTAALVFTTAMMAGMLVHELSSQPELVSQS